MSSQKTLVALVAGAAIGAIAGILLAPSSGTDTRKKLMKKGEGLCDQFTDLLDQGKSMLDEAMGTAKDATEQASKKVKGTMDKAEGAYDQAKSTAQKA